MQEKLPGGAGPPYFSFYCIFINKYYEICLEVGGGGVVYLYTPPPPPPLCASNFLSYFLLLPRTHVITKFKFMISQKSALKVIVQRK
jgi:hypothetical protein